MVSCAFTANYNLLRFQHCNSTVTTKTSFKSRTVFLLMQTSLETNIKVSYQVAYKIHNVHCSLLKSPKYYLQLNDSHCCHQTIFFPYFLLLFLLFYSLWCPGHHINFAFSPSPVLSLWLLSYYFYGFTLSIPGFFLQSNHIKYFWFHVFFHKLSLPVLSTS
jgi:hypothetical protein